MGEDINEDLIEATIRRVAASKAARLPDGPPVEDASPELHPVPPHPAGDLGTSGDRSAVDEDLISATLRRIEAEQAARAEAGAGGVVQVDGAERADEAAMDDREPATSSVEVDEDRITATLRRIQAEQAARAEDAVQQTAAFDGGVDEPNGQSNGMHGPVRVDAAPAVDDDRIAATLRRIEAQQAERASPPVPSAGEWTHDAGDETDDDVSWEQAARELSHQLELTRGELRDLAARVDALSGGTSAPRPAPTRFDGGPRPRTIGISGEWDDTPQPPHVPLGVALRPAWGQNPSPQTATAAQLDYDEDEPEAGVSAAETAAEPLTAKRGFELLPRTYRITVEDKRRGVDLVPLHRALLGLDGVRDISLLSYSNGTAIVAAESTGELSPDLLGQAVSHAMAREVKVEVHNELTMVIKLAED